MPVEGLSHKLCYTEAGAPVGGNTIAAATNFFKGEIKE